MSLSNKTYQPVQSISIKASADLPHARFIGYDGALSGDAELSLGVTEVSWLDEQYAQVITLGTAIVESAGTIAAGENVTSAANGKARKAITTDAVNGRALDSAEDGGFVRIKLVP